MTMEEIIIAKRDNKELTKEQIKSLSKYIRNKRLVSDSVINAVYEANKKDMWLRIYYLSIIYLKRVVELISIARFLLLKIDIVKGIIICR